MVRSNKKINMRIGDNMKEIKVKNPVMRMIIMLNYGK